jgi:hypothetical protein
LLDVAARQIERGVAHPLLALAIDGFELGIADALDDGAEGAPASIGCSCSGSPTRTSLAPAFVTASTNSAICFEATMPASSRTKIVLSSRWLRPLSSAAPTTPACASDAGFLLQTLGRLAGKRAADDAIAGRFPRLARGLHHRGLAGAGAADTAAIRSQVPRHARSPFAAPPTAGHAAQKVAASTLLPTPCDVVLRQPDRPVAISASSGSSRASCSGRRPCAGREIDAFDVEPQRSGLCRMRAIRCWKRFRHRRHSDAGPWRCRARRRRSFLEVRSRARSRDALDAPGVFGARCASCSSSRSRVDGVHPCLATPLR